LLIKYLISSRLRLQSFCDALGGIVNKIPVYRRNTKTKGTAVKVKDAGSRLSASQGFRDELVTATPVWMVSP
jgi:hypothetical protein